MERFVTGVGKTHLHGTDVQVFILLIRTPASTANNNAPIWEHTSPNPAIQLQCAVRMVPSLCAATQGFKGASFSRCEWLT